MTLIGSDRQWFLARSGTELDSTAREGAFCDRTVRRGVTTVVLDARLDPVLRDSPLVVGEPGVRFYAGVPLLDGDGVPVGAFCVMDPEPRGSFHEMEGRLLHELAAIAEARLRARGTARPGEVASRFMGGVDKAVIATDAKGRMTFFNRAAERLFGASADRMLRTSVRTLLPDDYQGESLVDIYRMLRAGASVDPLGAAFVGRRLDGEELALRVRVSSWTASEGQEFGLELAVAPATAAVGAAGRELLQDDVTGMLNLRGFRAAVAEHLSEDRRCIVACFRLSRFRTPEDAVVQPLDDGLVRRAAVRVAAGVGFEATFARVEPDVFAVAIGGSDDPLLARVLARDVKEALASRLDLAGHRVAMEVSAGVALAPAHAAAADDVFACARLALAEAGREGGGGVRMFDRSLVEATGERRRLETEMHRALERGEWELFFQPQVEISGRRLIGAEALLRWRHPARGVLPPATFMHILDAHLLSYTVGCWTIREACRRIRRWRDDGLRVPPVAVNLFASQVRSGDLETVVMDALAEYCLEPSSLELEITETIALENDAVALEPLRRLRAHGVGISLDDFGTGFASLSTIKFCPLSKLKIDRSFVRDLATDEGSRAVVDGMVLIADRLRLELVAEGIETEEQADLLARLGCDRMQGFLSSRPLTASGFQTWLDDVGATASGTPAS